MLPLLLVAALVQSSPADRAIDAAVRAYGEIQTAKASFEQTIRNPLIGSTLHSKGEFFQSRPNRFAFRFSDPAGDVILCDGHNLWIYLPSSAPGQVRRTPCGGEGAGSLDLIGEFFSNPRERYSIGDGGTATIGTRQSQVVVLTPRAPEAAFVRAKVWIDPTDGALLQFEAEEPSGLIRLVRITQFERNATVAGSTFTFRVPKGVKVVDVR